MATKYNVGHRTRWQHRHNIRLSDHLIDRWDDRTPSDSQSPEAAFETGVWLPNHIAHHWFDCDRARLIAEQTPTDQYVCVMIVEDAVETVGVTLYRVDEIDESARRAYCHAVADEVVQRG